jgi:hypothetical protein
MKIYFYGCSHTIGYGEVEQKNTWTTQLNIGVEYEPINRGIKGASWKLVKDSIFNDIGKLTNKDLIIVSVPSVVRLHIPEFIKEWNSTLKIRKYIDENSIDDRIGWMEYMENYDNLIEIVGNDVKQVLNILREFDFNFLWWSSDTLDVVKEEYLSQYLDFEDEQNYLEFVKNEKNKKFCIKNDLHLNLEGHILQSKIFSKQIISYLYKRKEINGYKPTKLSSI